MKILHVIPGDNFTEGMTYQDNYLASLNKKDGHEVMILSSCRTWKNNKVIYTRPENRVMNDGVRLLRVPYKKIFVHKINEKLRILKDTYEIVNEFNPDVIRILNPHNLTIPIIAKYKKKNPKVKIYVDSHQEFFNSAIGFISYWLFHKLLIKTMLQKNIKYIDKVFYCQEGTRLFLKKMYSIPDDKLEHYPMGGLIFDNKKREELYKKIRKELNLESNDIVLIHSGKLFSSKRTKDILEALSEITNQRLKLLLIGSIPDETKNDLLPLIKKDNRVQFLGWKNGDELMKYLCAGDIYLQPGGASVTVIQALCCKNAVVISSDIVGYDMLMEDSGWYAGEKNQILTVLNDVSKNPSKVAVLKKNAIKLAKKRFDYVKLARRLYN